MDENAVQLLFEGVDDGLGELISSLQTQLSAFLQAAQQADFSPVAQGGQAFTTLATGIQTASDANSTFVGSVTTSNAAVVEASTAAQTLTAATAEATAGTVTETVSQTDLLAALTANTAATAAQTAATTDLVGRLGEHGAAAQATTGHTNELTQGVTELASTAIPGLNTVLGQASNLTQSWGESQKAETNTLAVLGVSIAAVGVAIAGITFEKFIGGVEQLHQFALMSGMSTAAVQGLMTAMESVGVSGDRLQQTISIVSRNLETMQTQVDQGQAPTGRFADALRLLGVNAVDSSGNVQSFGALMPQIMDAFQAAAQHAQETGTTFNAAGAAVALFGRSGAQLVPLLLEGSGALAEFTKQAAALGIGSEAQVAQLEAWNKAQAELHLQLTAMVDDLGSSVAPVMITVSHGAGDVVSALNEIPGPLKEMVIVLPIVAGGLMLVVAGFQAARASALEFLAVNAEIIAIAAVIAAAAAALALIDAAQRNAVASADAFASHIGDEVKAMQALGTSSDEVRAQLEGVLKVQEQLLAEALKQEASSHNVGQYLLGMVGAGDWNSSADAVAHYQQVVKDLKAQLDLLAPSAAQVAQQMAVAQQANDKFASSLSATGLAAAGQVAAQTQLDALAKQSEQSTQSRTTVEQALTDALKISTQGTADYTTSVQNLDAMLKSADPGQKQYAQDIKDFLAVIQTLPPDQRNAADMQNLLNDAMNKTPAATQTAVESLAALDKQFKDGAITIDVYAQKLADMFSKPTAEELKFRQEIDQNKIAISDWQATIANSSPIDQYIANAQRKVQQDQISGGSLKTLATDQADLALQLAQVPAAEGQAIVANQQRVDALTNENLRLTDQKNALQDTRQASVDAANMASAHALSINDVTSHAAALSNQLPTTTGQTNDLASATKTAADNAGTLATNAGNTVTPTTNAGNAASGSAGSFNLLAGAVNSAASALSTYALNAIKASAIQPQAGGLPGIAPPSGTIAASAAASGSGVPADIIAWARANYGSLGVAGADPNTLAQMELTLSNYESGWGANPFQFMGQLASDYGQSGSAGSQLDVFKQMGRVSQAYAAYLAHGGGSEGSAQAEMYQEIPETWSQFYAGDTSPDTIGSRGGIPGFDPSVAAAQAVLSTSTDANTTAVNANTAATTASAAATTTATNAWIIPVSGTLTQGFGPTSQPGEPGGSHAGIDIAGSMGDAVVAATAGVVSHLGSDPNTGLGLDVEITTPQGYVVKYGHLSQQAVAMGQTVQQGQQIGQEGSTGFSTGPHVHFEIDDRNGNPVNPALLAGLGALAGTNTFTDAVNIQGSVTAGTASGTGALGTPGQLPVPADAAGGKTNLSGLTAQQQAEFNAQQQALKDAGTATHDLAAAQDTYNKELQPLIEKTPVTTQSLATETAARGPLIDTMKQAFTQYQAAAANLSQLAQSGTATPDQLTAAQNALNEAKTNFGDAAKAVHESNAGIAADTKALHADQVKEVNDLGTALETAYKAMYQKELDATKAYITQQQQADDDSVKAFKAAMDKKKQAADDFIAGEAQTAADALRIQQRSQTDALSEQQRGESQQLADAQHAQTQMLQQQQKASTDAFNAQVKAETDKIQANADAQTAALDQQTGQIVSAQMAATSPAAMAVRMQQESDLQGKIAAATAAQKTTLQNQLDTMHAEDIQAQATREIQVVQQTAQATLKAQQDAQQTALQAAQDALQKQQQAQTQALGDSQKLQTRDLQDAQTLATQAETKHWTDVKKASDDYYTNQKTLADGWLTDRKRMWALALTDAQQHYASETSATALNAQARYDIENGNQAKIVQMLATYDPDWNTAGKNMGQQLIDGLKASDIPGAVAQIFTDAGLTPPGSAPAGAPSGIVGQVAGGANAVRNLSMNGTTINVNVASTQATPEQITAAVQQGVQDAINEQLGRGAALAGVG